MITLGNNNIDNSKTMLLLRQLYLSDGYAIASPNNLAISSNMDFYLLKPFYGRIDLQSDTITNCSLTDGLINDQIYLKPFAFSFGQKAFKFTVDAFTEMRVAFNQKCANLSGLSTSGPLSGLEVYKAWESPVTNYSSHMDRVYDIFKNQFLNTVNVNDIFDARDFVKSMIKFITSRLSTFPITYGNYIISKYCSPRVSGLVIDLGNYDFGDDYEKTFSFVQDQNFLTYVQHAESYGFYIDRQAPWRLVQNLASSYTLDYMKKYGINSLEEFFNKRYVKNYKFDVVLLSRELHRLFNKFVMDFPKQKIIKNKNCPNIFTTVDRKEITFQEFTALFKPSKMLVIYCFLRAKELDLTISQSYFDNILDIAQKNYIIFGFEKACEIINNNFNLYKVEILEKGYLTQKNKDVINVFVQNKLPIQELKINI